MELPPPPEGMMFAVVGSSDGNVMIMGRISAAEMAEALRDIADSLEGKNDVPVRPIMPIPFNPN